MALSTRAFVSALALLQAVFVANVDDVFGEDEDLSLLQFGLNVEKAQKLHPREQWEWDAGNGMAMGMGQIQGVAPQSAMMAESQQVTKKVASGSRPEHVSLNLETCLAFFPLGLIVLLTLAFAILLLYPSSSKIDLAEQFVAVLGSRWVRIAIGLAWCALALAGVAVLLPFQANLVEDITATQGTDSAAAAVLMSKYFPSASFAGGFFIKSKDGSPLLDFAEHSTCKMIPEIQSSGSVISVNLACHNASALGGGCITKSDANTLLEEVLLKATGGSSMQAAVMHKALASYLVYFPSACPVATSLTEDWLNFTSSIESSVAVAFPMYSRSMVSFGAFPDKNITAPTSADQSAKVEFSIALPAGQFWQGMSSQLLSENSSISLVQILLDWKDTSAEGPPDFISFAKESDSIASQAPSGLNVRAIGQASQAAATFDGIEAVMLLSAMTSPIAFLIVGFMCGNLRLVIITILNLVVTLLSSILLMYPITMYLDTINVASAFMVAVSLALSIDYSLFLLTRFKAALDEGKSDVEATIVMLKTSGRIILVSGSCLLLCFFSMVLLRTAFLYTLGIAAGLTVLMGALSALTVTPVLLLSCPDFWCSDKRFGISWHGCCGPWGRPRSHRTEVPAVGEEGSGGAPAGAALTGLNGSRSGHANGLSNGGSSGRSKESCWPKFSLLVQKFAWPVAIALLVTMIPVAAVSLPRWQMGFSMISLMPTDSPGTDAFIELVDTFGAGAVSPIVLLVVPSPGTPPSPGERAQVSEGMCQSLRVLASEMSNKQDPSLAEFTTKRFTNVLIDDDMCNIPDSLWSSVGTPYSALKISVDFPIDQFSPEGTRWFQTFRDALQTPSIMKVGTWQLSGLGLEVMDTVDTVTAHLPVMIGVALAMVFVVIAVAFRSWVAPFRVVLGLTWMLVIVTGLAIFTFEDGMLSFLHTKQLSQRPGDTINFLTAAMSLPIIIGLGLDYDIFYSERVLEEWDHGHSMEDAITRGLSATGNVISAAGVIMVIAVVAILVGPIPVLNEVAFFFIFGVVIDCFVTTKVIIPCIMALLGNANFWPRKQSMATPEKDTKPGK